MRAREILFEDSRTQAEKLQDLIDHPATEETVREVARKKLKAIEDKNPLIDAPVRVVRTNVSEEHFNIAFANGIAVKTLYEGLSRLQPLPEEINFLRQGQVQMIVRPPFMNKTRSQYIQEICQACPGVRNVTGHMLLDSGYLFVISFI